MTLYYLLAAAFNVWMIIDAVRRRAEFYWFVILLLVPFGSLIYFFVVKAPELRGLKAQLPAARTPATSLPELQQRALETPSVNNKLALADRLEESEQYAEASTLYREVLRLHDDSKAALHGLARCLLGMGEPRAACEQLAKLMDLDSGFRDYGAALDYAEALWQSGERQDAIDLLRGLVGVSSRINHRVALAHYLNLFEQRGAARDELDRALHEYESAPAYVKKRDKKWADRAVKMLRELQAV